MRAGTRRRGQGHHRERGAHSASSTQKRAASKATLDDIAKVFALGSSLALTLALLLDFHGHVAVSASFSGCRLLNDDWRTLRSPAASDDAEPKTPVMRGA